MKFSEIALPKIFMQVAVLAALGFICLQAYEIHRWSRLIISLPYTASTISGNIVTMNASLSELTSGDIQKNIEEIRYKLSDIYDAIPNKDPLHLVNKIQNPRPLPSLP